jgi:hypothetical protein
LQISANHFFRKNSKKKFQKKFPKKISKKNFQKKFPKKYMKVFRDSFFHFFWLSTFRSQFGGYDLIYLGGLGPLVWEEIENAQTVHKPKLKFIYR